LPPLCVSLPSFFARRPVFSITSSLFLQNAGVGVPPQIPLLESATYRLSACKAVNSPVPRRNPFSVSSVPLWQIQFLFALCFHNLTNPFSRNSRVFTSIQIPRGCALKQSAAAATFGLPTTHYSLSALK
jgi:hypothetical protein